MTADVGGDRSCLEAIQRWLDSEPLWSRALAALRASGIPVYLVGGSVRDALLGRSGHDMDVAVQGDAIALGRWLADRLGGAYYAMDREHDVARIVFHADADVAQGGPLHIDLAGLRGRTIVEDLAVRDFTINAMGLSLAEPIGPLLDPTGGQGDLAAGLLRTAYPSALDDDPVRMLRALRLRAALGLRLHPETRAQIERTREQLERISRERVRDEFLAMLALPTAAPIHEAHDLGLLPLVVPLLTAEAAAFGLGWLDALHSQGGRSQALAPYWPPIQQAWQETMVEGRLRRALVALAALLAGLSASALAGLGARLRLSGREWGHLRGVLGALQEHLWAADDLELTPLEAHRYFRRYGEAGVDGAVLAVLRPGAAHATSQRASYLLWAWFMAHDRIVAPPRLLHGNDLIREFGLQPGPRIGRLLDALAEAQATGHVTNPPQARAYIASLISASSKGSRV